LIPVLVTGGAGYIGSHTAKVLAHSGFEPIVFDNLSEGHASAVRWGPIVRGDLGDPRHIRRVIESSRVEAVIHFAASAYVGESVINPRKYFHNNVANALNLLEAVLDSGVKYFVFSSTCATYGLPERIPIPEDHPQHPVSPYGESKLFVERALHWYGAAYGLNWLALRYFNAAGADPEAESGEDHDPETHLIPLAILAALGQRPALEIYGTDYPTPDGTAIRDYVHVSDLAEAHVLALCYLMEGGRSTALNVGTGRGHSVREVVAAVERVSGHRVPAREVSRRPGDPAVLIADSTMARRWLGWHPRYVELDEIVDTAWHWHASRAGARDLPALSEKQGGAVS
jgi:UDP-arabinose 4-epimerase